MNFVCNFEKCRLQLENDSGFSAMKKPGGGCLPFWEAPRGRCGFPAAPGTEQRAGGCCSLGSPESTWLCLSCGVTGVPPQSSRPVLPVQTAQCRLSPWGVVLQSGKDMAIPNSDFWGSSSYCRLWPRANLPEFKPEA